MPTLYVLSSIIRLPLLPFKQGPSESNHFVSIPSNSFSFPFRRATIQTRCVLYCMCHHSVCSTRLTLSDGKMTNWTFIGYPAGMKSLRTFQLHRLELRLKRLPNARAGGQRLPRPQLHHLRNCRKQKCRERKRRK